MLRTIFRRAVTFIAITALFSATAATAVGAQTNFTWPGDANVTSYASVEECLSAIERVRDSLALQARKGVSRDTLPFSHAEFAEPAPPRLIDASLAAVTPARLREVARGLLDPAKVVKVEIRPAESSD